MAEVFFYLTNENTTSFAIKLSEKSFTQHRKLHILCENQDGAYTMDETLWQLPANRFIPHALMNDNNPHLSPITIGFDGQDGSHKDILMQLSNNIPSIWTKYRRVIEIVGQDTDKVASRDRYRAYQEKGVQIQIFDLRKKS